MSKGVIYSLVSRMLFIFGGYLIHIYLARLLGPESYGVFGICVAVITIGQVFLNHGVRQVVSNSIARQPESARYFLNKGIFLQLLISITLGLIIVVFARNIAFLFNDVRLEKPLYLSALIIVMQSLVFVYMGVLNGQKKFGAECLVLSAYSIVKPIAAILLVYLGMAVIGGLSGFLFASIVAIILGIILTQDLSNKEYSAVNVIIILKSIIPVLVMFSGISVMMNLDLFAVKYFINDGQFAGYYTSAAAISKFIYRLFFAFGVVLLPFVSSSYNRRNIAQTQKYIKEVIRYSLLLMLPMVFLFCIYAHDLVPFVYGKDYHSAVIILRILIWGLLGLGLISVFSHAMIGIDQEKIMVKYALIGIVLSLCLNIALIPRIGVIGGAISTTVSAAIVAFLTYGYIVKFLNITIDKKGFLRVISSLLIMSLAAFVMNNIAMSSMFKGVILYVGFFILLSLLKEISTNDVTMLKNLIFSTSKS